MSVVPGHSIVVSLLSLFASTFVYMVYCLTYGILNIINSFVKTLVLRNDTKSQFGHVLWKRKFHMFEYASPRDFVCLYFTSVEPEYVLKPNVSLYSVTEKEAVFVETPGDINIYSSDENPFFHMAQFARCKNVIKMSIRCFHDLANKVGNPTTPVIWISSTARCGSTLLCQVLEKVPKTLLMAEPDAPANIDFMQKSNLISESERLRILKSSVRLLCMSQPGVERICVKCRGVCTVLMKDISSLFPEVKQIFMYRNCKETVQSHIAFLDAFPFGEVARKSFDKAWLRQARPFLKKQMEIYYLLWTVNDAFNIDPDCNTIGVFTYAWASYIHFVRNLMSVDENIILVKYEDLVVEKFETCRRLFDALDLHRDHVNVALTAFSKDSQRGSVVSQSRIGGASLRRISEHDRIKADAVLSRYSLSPMGEDFRI